MKSKTARAKLVITVLLLTCATAGARHRARHRGRLNMPPGWRWPPSADMLRDGQICLRRLDRLGVKWTKAPRTRKVTTPIYVPAMEIGGVRLTPIRRKGPFVMDCFLALALAERGAGVLRSAGVNELRFGGIYELRNVAGTRILSRHALGLAIDVFAFVTDDGTVHVVKDDYRRGDAVLLAVEHWLDDTGVFRNVLTPGRDPRHHRDHFHIAAMTFADQRRLKLIAGSDSQSWSPSSRRALSP